MNSMPSLTILSFLAVLSFCMGTTGFLVTIWRIGYWTRGFTESQTSAAESLAEVAQSFKEFISVLLETTRQLHQAVEQVRDEREGIHATLRVMSSKINALLVQQNGEKTSGSA